MGSLLKVAINKVMGLSKSFSFWFAIATIIIIPINVGYLPPFMILWFVSWIIEHRFKFDLIIQSKKSHLLLLSLFIALYIWQLTGMLYSDNPGTGWQNIIRRISLVMFPIILLSPGEKIKKNGILLLRIFAISTIAFILYCFVYAFYRSTEIQNGIFTFNPHQKVFYWLNYFYGTYFSIFQHPSYLAMYVLISVFIGFESMFDKTLRINYRISWLVFSIVLLSSLYFLSSRTGILTAFLILPFYFLQKSIVRRNARFAWLIIIIIIMVFLPLMLKNQRFNTFRKSVSGNSISEMVNQDERIIVWKAAFNIASENLILGVGTGDVNSALLEEHKKEGNLKLVENKLNAHNQYIEVLLENGLIGLIFFFSIFVTMFYIAFSEKNILYLLFILTVMIFFGFESMLNRLAGVSFFALFSFLIIHTRNGIIGDDK